MRTYDKIACRLCENLELFSVERETHGEIMFASTHLNVFMSQTEARQLIADIMVALDEPVKVDVTTQAYQEFPSIRDNYATATAAKIAFEQDLIKFARLYGEALKRGLIN